MSNEQVVTMRELEMESAELLPGRETLNFWRGGRHVTYNTSQSYDGNGILNILNGSNFLNGDSIAVVVG